MKNINDIDPTTIEGAVIDPKSGRLCALQTDISRALGISDSAVANCRAQTYQTRFVDIYEVIDARSKIRRRGRPTESDRLMRNPN